MDIERKIHFYLPMHSAAEPWRGEFPAAEAMDRFDALNDAGPDAAFLPMVNDRGLAARRTLRGRGGYHHGVLYLFREDNWPWARDIATGAITPVEVPNSQLALPTYFAMGPRNVFALLYNHTGPRIGPLGRYLSFSSDMDVTYAPIPNPQILRTLREANEVVSHRCDEDRDDDPSQRREVTVLRTRADLGARGGRSSRRARSASSATWLETAGPVAQAVCGRRVRMSASRVARDRDCGFSARFFGAA